MYNLIVLPVATLAVLFKVCSSKLAVATAFEGIVAKQILLLQKLIISA